jgi:DNA-binding MarR family transcriptional regulator
MRRPISIVAPPEEQECSSECEEELDDAAREGCAALGAHTPTSESRRLCELLMDLGRFRSLRDPLASICDDMQLTPTQVHALAWLGHDGPTHVGVLAQRIGITKKTITGVVDRLAEMGMVERTRDAEDRRAVVARLTERGTRLHERINRTVDSGIQRMLEMLEPADREALFGMLERVLKRLSNPASRA